MEKTFLRKLPKLIKMRTLKAGAIYTPIKIKTAILDVQRLICVWPSCIHSTCKVQELL